MRTATGKTNARNRYGVKSSIDLYRTIKGCHYTCWMSFPSDLRKRAYRDAGVRIAQRGVELFIDAGDVSLAATVDELMGDI